MQHPLIISMLTCALHPLISTLTPAAIPSLPRYETAAGFFLLAGSLKDAVGVIAKECADPQLALLVARLVEGAPKPGGAAWGLIEKVGGRVWCEYRAVVCGCLQLCHAHFSYQ